MNNPREILKRFLPSRTRVHQQSSLKFLGDRLHDPEIWHLTRRSAAGAVSVGLFTAFIPVPLQTVLAALGAFAFRVNLPIAIACVWITNPLTMAPLFYAAHRTGAWLLGESPGPLQVELSMEWFSHTMRDYWQPFLLGSMVFAIAAAVLGNVLVRLLWRLHLVRRWRGRRRPTREETDQG